MRRALYMLTTIGLTFGLVAQWLAVIVWDWIRRSKVEAP